MGSFECLTYVFKTLSSHYLSILPSGYPELKPGRACFIEYLNLGANILSVTVFSQYVCICRYSLSIDLGTDWGDSDMFIEY